MTEETERRQREPEALRDILKRVLAGRLFLLTNGRYVRFGRETRPIGGDDEGRKRKIICPGCRR